jgi:hypothetical protein
VIPRSSILLDPRYIRSSVIPIQDNVYDIGSATNRIRDIRMAGNFYFSGTNTKIIASTSDAADNCKITITGGGDSNSARGSYITSHGNEVASIGGSVYVVGGAISSGHISMFLSHASAEYRWYNSVSAVMWSMADGGTINQNASNGSDIVFNRSTYGIRAGTSDGSDNLILYFGGGGAINSNRGSYIGVSGNESASGGILSLHSGSIAGARVDLFVNSSDGTLRMYVNSGADLGFLMDASKNVRFYGTDFAFYGSSPTIRTNTSDGSDNQTVSIASGGAASNTRGGYISLYGNEVASVGGGILLQAGAGTTPVIALTNPTSGGSTVITQFSGSTNRYITFNGSSLSFTGSTGSGNPGFIITTTDAAAVGLYANATSGFLGTTTNHPLAFGANNNTRLMLAANGASITYYQAISLIANTSDGSDNSQIHICGGGAASNSRGGYINIKGNESSSGYIQIMAGDAGGSLYLDTGTSGAKIEVRPNASATIKFLNGFLFESVVAGNEATGAGSALLGANSPAVTNSAPYTWLKVMTSDGSTAYCPVWK